MNQTEVPQPPRRRRAPQYHRVSVRRVEKLSPHSVRVTLHGEDLARFETHGVAEHVKVLFPAAGQERPVLPVWTDDGPVYEPGVERPVSRTYTPRFWRPAALELDIDFLIHGDGPGSNWAAQVQNGSEVVVTMPGGPLRLELDARDFFIAGDESALPAIGTILEALPPAARAQVLVELEDASDQQALQSPARLDVQWLVRNPGDASGRRLERAVRELDLSSEARIFVACEAGVMREIRRLLLLERGLDRASIHTHGYWKAGVANHPDHDLGED
jgi:NADPH-dependent ferric siderophore reductase